MFNYFTRVWTFKWAYIGTDKREYKKKPAVQKLTHSSRHFGTRKAIWRMCVSHLKDIKYIACVWDIAFFENRHVVLKLRPIKHMYICTLTRFAKTNSRPNSFRKNKNKPIQWTICRNSVWGLLFLFLMENHKSSFPVTSRWFWGDLKFIGGLTTGKKCQR